LPQRFSSRRLRTAAVHAFTTGSLSLREIEMQAIQQALDRHAGNKPKAAEELGISLKTLYNKLNQVSQLEQSA
jgi:two-component system NtrC family response regulator